MTEKKESSDQTLQNDIQKGAVLQGKYEHLKSYLKTMDSVAVAYSSGVDSTFLLQIAKEVLGDRVLAVTASSEAFPRRELEAAKEFCRKEQIRHIIFDFPALELAEFRRNPENRCYFCKKAIFEEISRIARENGIKKVAEGSNLDDNRDYRPGMQAIRELGIKSPLRFAQLNKQEIRELSRQMGLPAWDKPSYACLASRFTYNEAITAEKLHMVEEAEELLLKLGFAQMRVRVHGQMARIEVLPQDFERLVEENIRSMIVQTLKGLGFAYVSLDLEGYRTGSMNERIGKSRESIYSTETIRMERD